MKLLFDQNLAPVLCRRLSDLFSDSKHVSELRLDQAEDIQVWDHARSAGFVIVSKDADFSELSVIHGFPLKVVWIRRGLFDLEIENILRRDHSLILGLEHDPEAGILLLY